MTVVRVPVAGTVGKAVRIESNATIGATIGRDLKLPDGSVPTLAELALALSLGQAPTSENSGNVSNSLAATLWRLIREVPTMIGAIASLSDPGADAIPMWDDSETELAWLTSIPDSFISQGSVTQHQAALSIAETQIVDGSLLARVGSNETITGLYSFQNASGLRVLDSTGADYVSLSLTDIDTDDFEFLVDPAYNGDSATLRLGDFDAFILNSFNTRIEFRHLGSTTNYAELFTTPGNGGLNDLVFQSFGTLDRMRLSGFSEIEVGNYTFDSDQTVGVGQDNFVLTYDHATGQILLEAAPGGLSNIVEDTTPQLGGALDGQGFDLNNLGVVFLTEQAAAEADVAGKGQFWVRNETPNLPVFTDDAGKDTMLLPHIYSGIVQATAINSTSDVTVCTVDVPNVAVGDQLLVECYYKILNNSGSTRVYAATFDFDDVFDIEISTGALAASGTLLHPFHATAVMTVHSASLATAHVEVDGQLAAGIASGGDTTMAANHLRGVGWGTSATDRTGTCTVNFKIRSASATATQTIEVLSFIVRRVAAN